VRLPPATPLESTLLDVFILNSLSLFRIKANLESSHSAQFWCNVTPFKINTCKTVSKQTTLTSFRINTYEKTREWGGPSIREPVSGNSSLPAALKSFLFTLLRTLLHRRKLKSFLFNQFRTLYPKTSGVGVSLPLREFCVLRDLCVRSFSFFRPSIEDPERLGTFDFQPSPSALEFSKKMYSIDGCSRACN
jgi:hypothetical protein